MMKKITFKNLITLVVVLFLSFICYSADSSVVGNSNFEGHRNVVVPLIVKKTIRQGGSSNYTTGNSYSSGRRSSGGGSSYGK